MSGGLEEETRGKYREEMEKIQDATNDIYREYIEASKKFRPFISAHEGIAVIREEYKELEKEIFKQFNVRTKEAMREEAKQLGAMALRFMVDICDD